MHSPISDLGNKSRFECGVNEALVFNDIFLKKKKKRRLNKKRVVEKEAVCRALGNSKHGELSVRNISNDRLWLC